MKRQIVQGLLAILLASVALAAEAAPATSYYVYDESGHVIGEYDANGNAIQEHIYLGDRPVAVVQGQGGSVGYVTTDQLNTPRAVTDSSKTVDWSWTSDPFGNGQPTGSLTYNLRFPGQYFDVETGHNYNYMRDYDPSTGRYTESDPIGLNSGIDTYVYALNNPITKKDPLGLFPGENVINAIDRFLKKGQVCEATPPDPCKQKEKDFQAMRAMYLSSALSGKWDMKTYNAAAAGFNDALYQLKLWCPEINVAPLPVPLLLPVPPVPAVPPPASQPPPG